MLFHAVPTADTFAQRPPPPWRTHLLPRYTTFWPGASRHSSLSLPHVLPPVGAWSGWELLMRALPSAGELAVIAL